MRSSASAALLSIAACNQVFGSREVETAPAQIFDAPIDAPFACPPIGTTPHFSPFLHQLSVTGCTHYSETSGFAVADCEIAGAHTAMIAQIGDTLEPAANVVTSLLGLTPRLSPDGQRLYIHLGTQLAEYTRASTDWLGPVMTSVPLTGNAGFSTVGSAAGVDRIIVPTNNSPPRLDEWERRDGMWMLISQTLPADLGIVSGLGAIAMTSDGRRLVVSGADGTAYTDRDSIAGTFRRIEMLEAPSSVDTFMTDDCARVYVSGLGSTFYAQQR